LNVKPDFSNVAANRSMMRIARRALFVMIAMALIASCRGAQEPDQSPKPQTVTLAIDGMT
jgi:hypothetical protein